MSSAHRFRVGERVRVRVGHMLPVYRITDPRRWTFATVERAESYEVKVVCDPPFNSLRFTIAVPDPEAILPLSVLEQLADAAREQPKRPKKKR